MKKLLLGITGISLLFMFVLASCTVDSTVDSTSKVDLQTLAAPASVTATAFGETGVIRVTWEPVGNARGYHVYRKSVAPKGGETIFMFIASVNAGNVGYLGIQDIIDFDNEFKQDVAYTYKVVALSEWSSFPGTGIPWNPKQDLVLQNSSKNSNEVKFDAKNNILAAAGSKLATPEITLDTVYTYSTSGLAERLQISWDVSPGVRYIVYYSYGSDVLIPYTSFVRTVNPVIGQTKYVTTFPLINGKTNVQLVAQHRATGASASYYLDSDPAVKNYDGAKTILSPYNANFSANGVSYSDTAIQLTWDDYAGAEYHVYRFTSTSDGYNSGGYIFDDWTEITPSINHDKNGTTWTAYDTDLHDQNQGHVYMLIAQIGDAKSMPAIAQAARPVSAPVLYGNDLGWNNETKEFKGIQLTWEPKYGQTYKLLRKTVNYDPVSGVILGPKTGTWETDWDDVPGFAPVPNNVHAQYAVVDNPPQKDSYRYKLIATQGTLKTESNYFDLTTSPYITDSVAVELSITNTPDIPANTAAEDETWDNYPRRRGTAYTIGVRINSADKLNKLLDAGDKVKVYRVKVDSYNSANEIGQYTELTLDTTDYANLLAGRQFIDGPLDPAYYKYKAHVVSAGGKDLRNTARNETVLSTAYSVSSPSLEPNPSGNGKRFEIISTNRNEYFYGLKLQLQYIDIVSGYPDWNNPSVSTLELTYSRNPIQDTPDSVNLYYTGNVPLPAATATTKRHYRLRARMGNGELSSVLSSGEIDP